MRVWCVFCGSWDGPRLEKIFTTKLAAETYWFDNSLHEYYEIEEWVVDE